MAKEVGLGRLIPHAYYLPMEYAHPSSLAIRSKWVVEDDRLKEEREHGSQRDMADAAFALAYTLVIEMVRLQIEHFNLDALESDRQAFQKFFQNFDDTYLSFMQ